MNTDLVENEFCIAKCVEWIKKHNYNKVGLEFPDKPEMAPIVSQLIKKKAGLSPYILQDTNRSCGDCCVDERTALPRNIDAVIHFGRTCLTPTQTLPVLFVFGTPLQFHLSEILERLQTDGPKEEEFLILVYDTSYANIIDKLSFQLKNYYPNLVTSRLIIPSNAEVVYPSTDVSEEVDKDIGDSDIKMDDHSTLVFNVRKVGIPSGRDVSDYNFIFIGPKTSCLTALQLRFSSQMFYQIDANSNCVTVSNCTKMVMNRSKKIEQIKEAKIIGILFTFLNGHHKIISRLKNVIKASGKRCYTFFMGKINEPKLGNIVGVDVFVYVACAESSLFDRNDNTYIYHKLVAPWEIEVALNPSFNWSLNFETNFNEFLSQTCHHESEDLENLKLRVEEPSNTSSLALRSSGILSEIHEGGAGEILQSLSWQGLKFSEEEMPIGLVVEGRRGIASVYDSELVTSGI